MGRRLGQHFLTRQSVLERIAGVVCPDACDLVIEIGPGKGALTSHLLGGASRVVAIEIDHILVQYLRSKYREESRLEVVESDVLKADLAQWGRVVVAGNLPYYITSPIVEKVLRLGALLERAIFLVQKEVADRLTAAPGNRDYGYLSVQTQLLAEVERLFVVPAADFRPPPKVDSAVVRLIPRSEPLVHDPSDFLRFASACFHHKRKTLRNNLSGRYDKAKLETLQHKRAEELSLPDLIALFRFLTQP